MHDISVACDVPGIGNEEVVSLIQRAVETTLKLEGMTHSCEVDVCLTDDAGIHEMNRTMRQIDAPTDVLSFPTFTFQPNQLPAEDDDSFCDVQTGLLPLGDMMISMERVKTQAVEYGHTQGRELAYLTVHSTLHLLGYDHMTEEDHRIMRQHEERIMETIGLTR